MATIELDVGKGKRKAEIAVIGVGGGGGNALDDMMVSGMSGVRFVAANTDLQALDDSRADYKIQLGERLTEGLGAGADPQMGRDAALEDQSKVSDLAKGCDMVFVTAGMGGGTGTGAAPVIAKACRDAGALTVGVVTKPFDFEGAPRMRNAEQGIDELRKYVDSLIVIPNDRIDAAAGEDAVLLDAFGMANKVLLDAVRSISDLIVVKGHINVDFADAKRIMKGKGKAIMGMGEGSGEGRAAQAAQRAMTSQLLEEGSIKGATGVLVNITSGPDMKLQEMRAAMAMIRNEADPAAEIIMGCVIDRQMTDKFKVTIIATGFDRAREFAAPAEMQMVAEAPMDSAEPKHWRPARPRDMLVQPPMPAAAPRTMPAQPRTVTVPERTTTRPGQAAMMPPPVPQGMQNEMPQPRRTNPEMPAVTTDLDFDPNKPNNGWF